MNIFHLTLLRYIKLLATSRRAVDEARLPAISAVWQRQAGALEQPAASFVR
jgi:hypothetical protein